MGLEGSLCSVRLKSCSGNSGWEICVLVVKCRAETDGGKGASLGRGRVVVCGRMDSHFPLFCLGCFSTTVNYVL